MLIGSYESVSISEKQVDAFNSGINKIGMLQNILHILSTLPMDNDGRFEGNTWQELNSDHLLLLFHNLEDMTADILDIYDCKFRFDTMFDTIEDDVEEDSGSDHSTKVKMIKIMSDKMRGLSNLDVAEVLTHVCDLEQDAKIEKSQKSERNGNLTLIKPDKNKDNQGD